MRIGILATLLVAPFLASGQNMLLSQGSIYVHPGTVLEISGPVEWNIPAGVQVINDGRIDLRNSAALIEAPGSPITGLGTEHSWMDAMQVNSYMPGGLGLELTSAAAIGPLEIVRGHVPIVMPNDQESIARWFRFAEGLPVELENLVLRYDSTELNDLLQNELDLYDAETADGYWVPMLAAMGQDQLSMIAYDVVPRQYITAFRSDAATSIQTHQKEQRFRVYPTISTDLVELNSLDDDAIEQVELFDMRGRRLPLHLHGSYGGTHLVIGLSHYESGPLLLKVNGQWIFKLVKA